MVEAPIFAFDTGTVMVQTADEKWHEIDVRYDPETKLPAPALELGKRFVCQGGQQVRIPSSEPEKQPEIVFLQGVVPVKGKEGETINIDFGNPDDGCGQEVLITKASPGGRLKCCQKQMSLQIPNPMPSSD